MPEGTYTLSFGVNVNLVRILLNGGYDSSGAIKITKYTFTLTSGGYIGFSFRRNDDTIWQNDTTIQIEAGTAASEYEPFVEPTTYPINADGTVDGIEPLYPTTTLMTDTTGIVIDAEYNRDINSAFAELTQAIISLGGNI